MTDRPRASAPPPVRLLGLGTAVPPHVLSQADVVDRLGLLLPPGMGGGRSLDRTVANAGIVRRHAVCPLDWFDQPHSWAERMARYLEGAQALFEQAAVGALTAAGVAAADVDTVITVSSTGITTPTLEARAMARLGFRAGVHRVPVFGLGCAGGVTGLGLAQRLAASRPGAAVLLVCVETCTLHFRADRGSKADLIATLLFGDGAAAALVAASADPWTDAPAFGEGVEHLWPDTLDIMGWEIDEHGFGVVFDRSIPAFVAQHLADALTAGLHEMRLEPGSLDRMVCHPGGTKVLEAIESTLALGAGRLDHERTVLRDFGNMSAPTVLFVLDRALRHDPPRRAVLAALGPGFTVSMLPMFRATPGHG